MQPPAEARGEGLDLGVGAASGHDGEDHLGGEGQGEDLLAVAQVVGKDAARHDCESAVRAGQGDRRRQRRPEPRLRTMALEPLLQQRAVGVIGRADDTVTAQA